MFVVCFSYLCRSLTEYVSEGSLIITIKGFKCFKSMDKMVETIVEAIQDKKGKNIVSLDMSGFDGAICSHFVICNADSTTQVEAISNGVEELMEQKLGEKLHRVEGRQMGLWVAMDYIDVVVHIFQSELRDYYRLEQLWSDAVRTEYESEE